MPSSMGSVEIVMGIFLLFFIVIVGVMLAPPTRIVDAFGKKKKPK
jgi:hypothetical protein